jgi:hypothetical protein
MPLLVASNEDIDDGFSSSWLLLTIIHNSIFVDYFYVLIFAHIVSQKM